MTDRAPASPKDWYQEQAELFADYCALNIADAGNSDDAVGAVYEETGHNNAKRAAHFGNLCALLDRLGCQSLEDVEGLLHDALGRAVAAEEESETLRAEEGLMRLNAHQLIQLVREGLQGVICTDDGIHVPRTKCPECERIATRVVERIATALLLVDIR